VAPNPASEDQQLLTFAGQKIVGPQHGGSVGVRAKKHKFQLCEFVQKIVHHSSGVKKIVS
jgi:hypothetical protein